MKPVICSFYTKEYAELAAQMEKSARSFGFETHVIEIPKINNSWLDTIYWRPEFIMEMLARLQRPVVWLDCDAIVEKDPVLFNDFTGDFGIHIHDFQWQKRDHLGGTMYFAFNDRVIDFLQSWIDLNKTMSKQNLSQKVIPYAIKRCPDLKIVELPANYCQIFDLMADCGEPVISHHQASRKFRK